MANDDELLRRIDLYLSEENRSLGWRNTVSERIERLVNQSLKTDHRVEAGFVRIEADLGLIKAEQAHMMRRISDLEEEQEVTGVTRLDDLQKRLDSERAKSRGMSKVALGIISALVVALLTAGTALAVRALTWKL